MIVSEIFRNDGIIESLGGNGLTKTKYVYGKTAKKIYLRGGDGRIAVYTKNEEEGAGSIKPDAYFGSFEEGLQIINNIRINPNKYIIKV